ncbi:MAG: aldehyde dehydrogenase family protein, partial [Betaproteobacteria bacterium]|nr:aldehyde dehydrogenase family protein [Betaproteobacteria bacterium]
MQLPVQFARMRAAARADPAPDQSVRSRRLAALEALLNDHRDEIASAISADFGHRSRDETRLLELFPSLEAVRHARRHLGRWMRTQRRPVSLWFQPAGARVMPQPLGVVGIIVPWNYPVFLAMAPLVGALAAGNRVMVKMSEYVPATADLLARLVASRYAVDELAVVTG